MRVQAVRWAIRSPHKGRRLGCRCGHWQWWYPCSAEQGCRCDRPDCGRLLLPTLHRCPCCGHVGFLRLLWWRCRLAVLYLRLKG